MDYIFLKKYINFSGENEEVIKLYINNVFLILGGLGNIEKCNTYNINNIIKKISKIIKNEKKCKKILYYIPSMSDFYIEYQIMKIINYTDLNNSKKLYFYSSENKKDIVMNAIKNSNIINKSRCILNQKSAYFIKYIKNNLNKNISFEILDKIL